MLQGDTAVARTSLAADETQACTETAHWHTNAHLDRSISREVRDEYFQITISRAFSVWHIRHARLALQPRPEGAVTTIGYVQKAVHEQQFCSEQDVKLLRTPFRRPCVTQCSPSVPRVDARIQPQLNITHTIAAQTASQESNTGQKLRSMHVRGATEGRQSSPTHAPVTESRSSSSKAKPDIIASKHHDCIYDGRPADCSCPSAAEGSVSRSPPLDLLAEGVSCTADGPTVNMEPGTGSCAQGPVISALPPLPARTPLQCSSITGGSCAAAVLGHILHSLSARHTPHADAVFGNHWRKL